MVRVAAWALINVDRKPGEGTMKNYMALAALAMVLTTVVAEERLSVDSLVDVILDNPAAKQIIAKHLPNIAERPELEQARGMVFRDLQQYDASITNEKLAAIDADLAKIETKK
jgi:hypothetical protein